MRHPCSSVSGECLDPEWADRALRAPLAYQTPVILRSLLCTLARTAWTNDDAIQRYTIEAVDHFLAQRKNPNGAPVRSGGPKAPLI